jgi:hypothetical protein
VSGKNVTKHVISPRVDSVTVCSTVLSIMLRPSGCQTIAIVQLLQRGSQLLVLLPL